MNLQDSEGVALGSVLAERKAGNLAIEQLPLLGTRYRGFP